MTQARTWLGIYAAGFAVLTGFLCVTLFTQAPFGDMTRVARVSEDAFGWHLTPPLIADEDVRNAPLDQADVLVIGDSFSMFFAWQASLVKAGYRVTTTHWDKIGPLCDDFAPWLRKAGFKGRLVIIESIERLGGRRSIRLRDRPAVGLRYTSLIVGIDVRLKRKQTKAGRIPPISKNRYCLSSVYSSRSA